MDVPLIANGATSAPIATSAKVRVYVCIAPGAPPITLRETRPIVVQAEPPLQAGDLILRINGIKVTRSVQLVMALRRFRYVTSTLEVSRA